MTYFIGIDGGGTKTEAAAIDLAGRELLRLRGGATNPYVAGMGQALRHLERLLDDVMDHPRLQARKCALIGLGLSGIDAVSGAEEILRFMADYRMHRRLTFEVEVRNDSEIVLSSAGLAHGVAVISGTGSIVYGKAPDGRSYRVGGWGEKLGDEGSGYRIALETLRAVMQSYDGVRPPTSLTARVLAWGGFSREEELKDYVHHTATTKRDIAAFARCCVEACAAGDEAAIGIIRHAAEELAVLTMALIRKHPGFKEASVVAAGSVFQYSAEYAIRFRQRLQEERGADKVIALVRSLAYGAAIVALRQYSRTQGGCDQGVAGEGIGDGTT